MAIKKVRLDFMPVGDEVSRSLCGADEEVFSTGGRKQGGEQPVSSERGREGGRYGAAEC